MRAQIHSANPKPILLCRLFTDFQHWFRVFLSIERQTTTIDELPMAFQRSSVLTFIHSCCAHCVAFFAIRSVCWSHQNVYFIQFVVASSILLCTYFVCFVADLRLFSKFSLFVGWDLYALQCTIVHLLRLISAQIEKLPVANGWMCERVYQMEYWCRCVRD